MVSVTGLGCSTSSITEFRQGVAFNAKKTDLVKFLIKFLGWVVFQPFYPVSAF